MIYKQLAHLPIIFQVDEEIILNVNEILNRNKLTFSNVLVASGTTFSKKYADQIAVKNDWNTYVVENNTFEDVELLKTFVIQHNIDLIIGVGGGKVIDLVKRVSYLSNINHLSIPTIISNDGLISPIAVIKNKAGKTESIPGMMPLGVIIDITIIKDSPIRFIRAAAGDILSNVSATNDWVCALKKGKENINDIAFHLAKGAANALIHYKDIDLKDKQFLRLVVHGQMSSGIAMSLAGTSRPCSGSEHLISHAIDFLDLSSNILHGTQVASISLFTLFLQGKLKERHVQYAKATGIPVDFSELIIDFNRDSFKEIIQKAKKMRPGRYTILDEVQEEHLFDELLKFKAVIAKM